ncbi:MAG: type II toxin-antitoxin system HicA family toxin [Armatimonadota bacterium]|nr:type II toxin-antitoxin system HicA family toxin [Armatimonadota bacterium]
MPSLPVVSGRECCAALSKVGFNQVRQTGSHIIMRRTTPEGSTSIPVPDHRELASGTLRSIIRQAGLTVEEFVDLL